jgi:WD40 repeat protein
LSFKAILFLRFNASQDARRTRNKVLVSHHPKMEIMATIGRDQQIIFWDTEHNKLLHVTELTSDTDKKYPTAIKFSHNGDHLIIGFSDGELMFLESKMSKSMQSKTDEKYCPLNLGKAKKEKGDDGQAVLNIELSDNGEYIAVSYQKIVGDKSYSYIKISHFKIK